MPPKLKVSREEIIEKALEIVEESGIEAVTARELGRRMGISSRPLYSHFESVEQLKDEIFRRIFEEYRKCITSKADGGNTFLDIGLNYIKFAAQRKEFYRVMHYYSGRHSFDTEMSDFDDSLVNRIRTESPFSELDHDEMKDIYYKMGIFSHGLADMMFQNRIEDPDDREIVRLLTETGDAVIRAKLDDKKESK